MNIKSPLYPNTRDSIILFVLKIFANSNIKITTLILNSSILMYKAFDSMAIHKCELGNENQDKIEKQT